MVKVVRGIKEAKEAGYIMQYDDGDMMLTDKGKMFAIENNIVQ